MLNSLVRVSRRVGGDADLLATEMRTVAKSHSLKETAPLPAAARAKSPGLESKASKLHPSLRSDNSGSSREAAAKCRRRSSRQRGRVLADPEPPSRPNVTLNRHRRLQDPLRLLLHSFTYFLSHCHATFYRVDNLTRMIIFKTL